MQLRSVLLVSAQGSPPTAALESAADAIAFDLTAAAATRVGIAAALEEVAAAGKRALAVVNHPRTGRLPEDIEAVVGPSLHAVGIECFEPQDVRDTAVLLREFELARGIEPGAVAIVPVVGSARGLLRDSDIAGASPRVAGLVFDAAAFARDTGARLEEAGPRLAYARGRVVTAARAIDALPLISGVALHFRDMARYGFAGAIVDTPARAALVHEAFAVSSAGEPAARS